MRPPGNRLTRSLACATALLAVLGASATASAAGTSMHSDVFDGSPARIGPLEPAGSGGLPGSGPSRLARASRLAALPRTWCGTERRRDDTEHASTAGPRIKLVYAYASGIPDRSLLYRDLIQQDVALARSAVAAASRGRKTIRFDMGTDCPRDGARYVDIQTVALPHDGAYYGFKANSAAAGIRSDLRRSLRLRGRWNVTAYVDGVSLGDTGGIASVPLDETRGAANESNRGGRYAFVFGDGSPEFSRHRQVAVMHETLHTLGAVQDGAPHATGLGHCFDGEDVMCYDDGGPTAPRPWPAPTCAGALRIDCGNDDYFAPRPAHGSYLASHWNVFDSAFMCDLASCDTRDVGGSVRASLSAAVAKLTGRLRRAGLPGAFRHGKLRARFDAPRAGRVGVTIAMGHRKLFAGSRRVGRAGRVTVSARPLARARRLVRAASLRIAVRVSFRTGGHSQLARASMVLVRRR